MTSPTRHAEPIEGHPGLHRVTDGHVNAWIVEADDHLVLVDCGLPHHQHLLDAAFRELGRRPSDVAGVLLTHAHADHLGAAQHLADAGAQIYAHRDEVHRAIGLAPRRDAWAMVPKLLPELRLPHSVRFVTHAAAAGFLNMRGPSRIDSITDTPLDLPGRPVPIPTPGHTAGHCAYLFPNEGLLFSGDTIVSLDVLTGQRGPRPMPALFAHDPDQARSSLDALAEIDAAAVLPGHGEPLPMAPRAAVTAAQGWTGGAP